MNEWHNIPSSLTQNRRSRARVADPIVYEDGESITLQFLIGEIQSEMCASDPTALMMTYTRPMAAFTSFHRKPKHIAIIGLGGGSLPKWCYHQLPESEITVIELNPKVIALRERFIVPPDCERFRVLCADGADYVSTTSGSPPVLLVDGFDIDGQPAELCSQDFYDNCYRTLREDGVLVVNICDHRHQREMLARIRLSFGVRVTGVTPEPRENTIAFATKGEQLQPVRFYRSRYSTACLHPLAFSPSCWWPKCPQRVSSERPPMSFLNIAMGWFLGFMFGVGCALAVMYSIYQGGYRKAVEDSLKEPQPEEYTALLRKTEAAQTRISQEEI